MLDDVLDLSPQDVFCSSLEGMGIPSGTNFVDYIKSKIQNPELVILMLSPNYFDSMFCQCELGAAWALSNAIVPVLIPPADYSDLKAVLTGIQVRKINSDTDLAEMRDELVKRLGLDSSVARWDAKRKQFLAKCPHLLEQQTAPTRVTFAKYSEMQKKYDDGVKELEGAFAQIDSQQRQIEELKKCKDAHQVAEITAAHSTDWELFETLCEEAKNRLGKLPRIVQVVLYHVLGNHEYVPPAAGSWKDQDTWDEIRAASQDDYLEVDSDDNVGLNQQDPTVHAALRALQKVEAFLEGGVDGHKVGNEFKSEYVEKYNHRLSFSSRKFWNTNLNL